jgi:hypothetical protein
MGLQIRERGCPVRENQGDHIAEATIIGTAVTRFTRAAQRQGTSSLSVLSLDPQRRQAARMGNSATRDAASQAAPFALPVREDRTAVWRAASFGRPDV